MNSVLGWLKSNVLIVVFGVLILVLPPAGYVMSSMWNADIKKQAEETLADRKRKVDSAARVTYTLPPIAEGEQPVQETRPPNAAITEFFEAQRAARQSEIEEVVTRAVRFNKRDDRTVLMEGLFPGLDDEREERRMVRELAAMIAGGEDGPSVYQELFEGINAGEPMDKAAVARRVIEAHRAEIDKAGGDLSSLTEEELAELDERLKALRLGAYARRAGELSVYGSLEALRGADPITDSVILDEAPVGSVDATDAFIWQMDYWFVEDLLRAVGLANRTEDGLRTEIPRSPVKRIVSIRLGKMEIPEIEDEPDDTAPTGRATSRSGASRFGGLPVPTGVSGGGSGNETHTGRTPDDKNGVYQIRRGTLTVVAASDKLVRLLESIQQANFMTVTSVSLSEVDRWADLADGYAYGPDHVVRAEIGVESAWLHFWLSEMVTDRVAAAWGVERPAVVAEGEAQP